MKTIDEKEKKLNDILNQLKNLDILKSNEITELEKLEQKKQTEFSEKIDELNQETDTLLEEIDKWQM